MSQAGGLALPATITLGKLWKTLSSGSLSRKPLPLLGKKKKKGDREVAQRKCDRLVNSSPLKFLARKKKGKNSESKNSNEPSNFGGKGKGSPAEVSGEAQAQRPWAAPGGAPEPQSRRCTPQAGAAGEAARWPERGCVAGGPRPGWEAAGDRAQGGRWGGGGWREG